MLGVNAESSITELLAAFRGSGRGGGAARLVAERQLDVIIVHKDPEFEKVAELKQEKLPYK